MQSIFRYIIPGIYAALIFMILIFACACQPTPTETVIVNKGDGKLEEKINQTPAAAGEASAEVSGQQEKWQEELDYPESHVKVIIDANVERPDTNEYPVIKVVPHDITLDEAKKYVDIFLHDKQLYELFIDRTKSEINDEIISVKAKIEKEKNNTDRTESERQMDITTYQDELKSLEEEYIKTPTRTTAYIITICEAARLL